MKFDNKAIEGFRKRLEDKKESLIEMKSNLQNEALKEMSNEATGELSNARLHPSDLGTMADLQEVELKIADSEGRELVEIRDALSRLAEGTYGDCEECGEAIGLRRLEVQPEARYCIQCQKEHEVNPARRYSEEHEIDFNQPIVRGGQL